MRLRIVVIGVLVIAVIPLVYFLLPMMTKPDIWKAVEAEDIKAIQEYVAQAVLQWLLDHGVDPSKAEWAGDRWAL